MSLLAPGDAQRMVAELNATGNAALVEIAAPGALAPNGDPTFETVWTGAALGTLDSERQVDERGDVERIRRVNTFTVYDATGAPVDQLLAGDDGSATTVVIEDRRGASPVQRRWTVRGVAREADMVLNAVTLTLDAEEAP